MKSVISIIVLAVSILLASCSGDDKVAMIKDPVAAQITTTGQDLSVVVTSENLTSTIPLAWDKADYGVNTQVDYTIEIDTKCHGFSSPVVIGSTTDANLSIALTDLNTKLISVLHLAQDVPAQLELRVKSAVKGASEKISNPVEFTVTPYSERPALLWMLSDKWEDLNSPVVQSTGSGAFQGYLYVATKTNITFANTLNCGASKFGADGEALKKDGAIVAVDSGYYFVNLDTAKLTYSFAAVSTWGMIGTATPGGWNTSSPLTYDPASNVWTATIELANGAMKFRANNGWDLNYGPNVDAFTGVLVRDGGAVSISQPGTYKVTLDLSNAASPYDYSYVVEKKSDIVKPQTLWMPGSYQSTPNDPSQSDVITLYSVTGTANKVYDAYVSFAGATTFTFTDAADNTHGVYTASGDGVLVADNSGSAISIPAAGYYRIHVDIGNLAYSVQQVNTFDLIGTATAGGWNTSTFMDYDPDTKLWTKTVDLVQGALKFRANGGWAINYGPADSNSLEGQMLFDDQGAININVAGNYTVTVDLTRSQSPYQYVYSVKKN